MQARLLAIGLFVVTFAIFSPTLRYGFVNLDDLQNFIQNRSFRGLAWSNLQWMWTTTLLGPYQPLSWMTLGLDYLIWGEDSAGQLDPTGYHLTNVLLHATNVVLVFWLALRILSLGGSADRTLEKPESERQQRTLDESGGTGFDRHPNLWGAAVAALAFGIHPLRAEVVAWCTERRELLSTTFLLWSVLAYLSYCRDLGASGSGARRRNYLISLGAFTLALLSKAMGMTLAVALLVLDFYPLQRIPPRPRQWLGNRHVARALLEKLPYVLIAIPIMAIAARGQYGTRAMANWQVHPLTGRLAQCCYGLIWYPCAELVPLHLIPLYPLFLPINPLSSEFLTSIVATIGITVAVWFARFRWPAGLAVWASYGVLVSPVLGLVQTGPQIVADRYSYLPCIPFALLGGACFRFVWVSIGRRTRAAAGRSKERIALGALMCVLFSVLAGLTLAQLRVWSSSFYLWDYVVRTSLPNAQAEVNLGDLLFEEERDSEAELHFTKAMRGGIPWSVLATCRMGNLRMRQDRFDEAMTFYHEAMRRAPNYPEPYYRMALINIARGERETAKDVLSRALKFDPRYVEAHVSLGDLLAGDGDFRGAIQQYQLAVESDPDNVPAQRRLAFQLRDQGELGQALEHLRRAHEAARDKLLTPEELEAELRQLRRE